MISFIQEMLSIQKKIVAYSQNSNLVNPIPSLVIFLRRYITDEKEIASLSHLEINNLILTIQNFQPSQLIRTMEENPNILSFNDYFAKVFSG